MSGSLHYYRGAERPDIKLWLLDDDGALIDFSSGYTFVFKLGVIGEPAVFTKTEGITGAAGSGTEGDGAPNVTVTFAADELDGVPPAYYVWQLKATSGGLDRFYVGQFLLDEVIL